MSSKSTRQAMAILSAAYGALQSIYDDCAVGGEVKAHLCEAMKHADLAIKKIPKLQRDAERC